MPIEQAGVEQAGIEQAGVEQAGIEQAGVEQTGVEQTLAVAERRTEIRRPADGDVRLWPESLEFTAIQGRLLDVASSGFRARHSCQALGPGQFARFEYDGASGRASVVWNRITGGEVETGFRIVRHDIVRHDSAPHDL